MTILQPVKPGLSAPIVTSIPDQWSKTWFRSFITNYLQNADIRNAVTPDGGGVQVSASNFTQPATISFSPIPNNTVYGNVSGTVAPPVAITSTQLTTLINVFTTGIKGAVPPSPGGVTDFLRADGQWAGLSLLASPPTALVGLTAVDGTANSFMSSDSAPALDQSIAPTMTGDWIFLRGVVFGTATGGNRGDGSINARAYYLNGSPLNLVPARGPAGKDGRAGKRGPPGPPGTSGGGGSAWTITDGAHTVTGVTTLSVTGAVVGGTTPNATLTVSTGGSPLTTKGDIFGFSTTAARIPVGANGTVLTADSTAATGVSYQTPGAGGGGLLFGQPDFVVPPSAGWTWLNQGSNTVATIYSGSALRFFIPPGATNDSVYAQAVTPGTFTATACFMISGYAFANFSRFGIGWVDSATGHSEVFCVDLRSNPVGVSCYQFTTGFVFAATVFGSVAPVQNDMQLTNIPLWLQAVRDGSNNVTMSISTDGVIFVPISASNNPDTSNWVANPDTIGLIMLNDGSSGNASQNMSAIVYSFHVGP